MKTSRFCLTLGLVLLPQLMSAQRIQQQLGRGVVAVNNSGSVTVTWRRLAQEAEDATYNVYVNGVKKTSTPLSNTNWKTTTGTVPVGSKVAVSIIQNGTESEPSEAFVMKSRDARSMFMDINFEQGGSPLKSADFNTAYVWPIDLDGNGEYDYVVNRKSNANSLDCYVEAYLASGQHLWTVKLGPNELSCAGQDDMITVADMDCDGLGDVIIQSSDGTQFWDAVNKTFGLYVNGKTTGDTDGDGIIDYEKQNVRNAPRYISIIDGLTGAEKATIEQSYNQHYNRTNRASLMGDEYNKHVGHMGVFFFDGIHPAVVMEWHMRGSGGDHHYYNLGVAYDFSSGKAGELKELFNLPTGGPAFHQIRIGDVDGDGRDEMIVGGYTMDHTGKTLFNTGIAHGDRFRTSDIDPERPGLETFAIQQNAPDMLGQVLYDARTGEFIKKWYLSSVGDVGRGECMDIDKNHLGWEMWSTMAGVYDAQGNLITGYDGQYPCEGIWWDTDPDREVVQTSDSHHNVYVQDFFNGRLIQIAKDSGYRYITVYAKRAAFWGDIIGDWREELILLHNENGVTVGICGFTTDYTTSIKNIYCLQEDPHYRGDCSTKGYYQSPNPGFYLGYDMPRPQLPPCMSTDLIAKADGEYTTFDRTAPASYADGKSVLFDLTYGNGTFTVSGAYAPSIIYAMPVREQTITFSGSGSVEGSLQLWKSQQGRLVVNTPLNHTGGTFISEGILEANTTIQGDVDLRARGTLAGDAVVAGKLNLEGALNYEGGRLMPGGEVGDLGGITLKQGLTINQRLFVESDIKSGDASTDLVKVEGDLTISGKGQLVFTIVPDTEKPAPARYKLMEYTGTFTGNLSKVSVRGLQGLSYSIVNEEQALWLVINEQRDAAQGVRWTGSESTVWDYQTANFSLNGESTEFVANDGISIGDDALKATIQIDELM
ncbi:MAG: cellulosome protein, partial [Bacteroidaceae bacterium]|nr:cellulosome protein [Bacteroidaceae bacterium]